MKNPSKTLVLAAALAAAPAVAADAEPQKHKRLVEALESRAQLDVKRVAAAIPGIFEVELESGDYLYATEDGRHLFAGDLYEVGEDGPVSLTERVRTAKRRELIAGVAAADVLAFAPPDAAKAAVLVFTDTDCGYCRKLHREIDDYLAHGIEVRYLAYPRAGVDSDTYNDMVSAWCAEDPQAAMTALKRGEGIPSRSCENPVAGQYALGRQIGIGGTPTIILPSGRLVPGYVDADTLAEYLGI